MWYACACEKFLPENLKINDFRDVDLSKMMIVLKCVVRVWIGFMLLSVVCSGGLLCYLWLYSLLLDLCCCFLVS
jgi:hypothetical protein